MGSFRGQILLWLVTLAPFHGLFGKAISICGLSVKAIAAWERVVRLNSFWMGILLFLWKSFGVGGRRLEWLMARCVHSIFYLRFLEGGVLFRKLVAILGGPLKGDIPVFVFHSRDDLGSEGGLMAWVTILIGGVDVAIRLVRLRFY